MYDKFKVCFIDGTPYEVKVSRTVWRRGKDGDNIKVLPIPMTNLTLPIFCRLAKVYNKPVLTLLKIALGEEGEDSVIEELTDIITAKEFKFRGELIEEDVKLQLISIISQLANFNYSNSRQSDMELLLKVDILNQFLNGEGQA